MDAAEGPAGPVFTSVKATQPQPVRRRRSSSCSAQFGAANGLYTSCVVGQTNMYSDSTAGAITTAAPAASNVESAQACSTRCSEVHSRTSLNARSQPPCLHGRELFAGASKFLAGADFAAIDATTCCSSHQVSYGASRSGSSPTTTAAAGIQDAPTRSIAGPEPSGPVFRNTTRPSHLLSSAPAVRSTSSDVNTILGVTQGIRGLEHDSVLDIRAGSGAPQCHGLLQEAVFTDSSSRWAVNSGWADSADRTDAPRTTASRLVLQAERVGATVSVPGILPQRRPAPPALTEIQRNLTYIGESTTPRETDVAATTTAATGSVNSSASLTSASASETGVKSTTAIPAVSDGQDRFEHVTYCSICSRCPGVPPEGTPEDTEVVFCGTCPRKFCLSCFQVDEPLGTLASEAGEDEYSIFRRIPNGCSHCRRGTDREVPKQVHMHAEELFQLPYLCVAGAEIPRVMKAMLQWLRSHDLARFFVEDVDVERVRGYKRRVKTPMSLAKIRRNIDSQAYSGEPVEAGMALPTEAGMALFLRDLALIEYNCKRFNRKLAGITRSAALLVERAHLYYQSHIEPLAAELGFPHMLSKLYACKGRGRVGSKDYVANRGSGEQGTNINGAASGTGDRASTRLQRSSAAPPTSSSSNWAEPRDGASTPPPLHTQSTSTLSPGASSFGAGAGFISATDISTDPVTDAVNQARTAHHAQCYICGQVPETGHRGRSDGEEVVFCKECPRMFCAPCYVAEQPVADRSKQRQKRGRDRHGAFWLSPHCGYCLSKANSKTPSAPRCQPAVAGPTSVGLEPHEGFASIGTDRPVTANASTAALPARLAKLQPHFEADRAQIGIGGRERFPVGQVVWVIACFAAEIDEEGFVQERMHVPGVVQDIKEAVGTSPALFTVNCFGRAEAVVQETADKLFLFPMEGDLESAKRAVTDGLWPGEAACAENYLNFAVAEAIMECIKSSWNPATGTNIYLTKPLLDTIKTDKKIKEYAETWGMDSAKLAQLLQEASFAGPQGCTRTIDGYGGSGVSCALDSGGAYGMGAAVRSVGGARDDGDNRVSGAKDGVGKDADAAAGEAPRQAGSHRPSIQASGSQRTRTERPPAMRVSTEAMSIDPDTTYKYGSDLSSAAGEMTETPTQPPTPEETDTDGTAASTPPDERSTLPPCSKCFEAPPPFKERDFPQGRY